MKAALQGKYSSSAKVYSFNRESLSSPRFGEMMQIKCEGWGSAIMCRNPKLSKRDWASAIESYVAVTLKIWCSSGMPFSS
jgi:hypothetical protein